MDPSEIYGNDIRCLKSARTKLIGDLLGDLRRDQWITILALSSKEEWVTIYKGLAKQLDLTWVASLSPAPLCSQMYRVEYCSIMNSSFYAQKSPGANVLSPRDIMWLSDPGEPHVLSTSARDVVLGWPKIEGCRRELYTSAVFQVEVREGPAWQPARVQQQKLRLASSERYQQRIFDEQETSSWNDMTAFFPLKAVDGVGGVRVIDLRPATWYYMRLRVSCCGKSAAFGPPVLVSTRCGIPDMPTPKPRIIQEQTYANGKKDVPNFEPLVALPATARSLCSLMDHTMEERSTLKPSDRLRISWSQPSNNGYPIQRYILQQRELVLDPPCAHNAPNKKVLALKTRHTHHGLPLNSGLLQRWTPWHVVHASMLPECLIRAPAQCPASVILARQTLGLGKFKNSHAAYGRTPVFTAMEFRVAAVNVLGASKFSQVSRISEREYPHFFTNTAQRSHGILQTFSPKPNPHPRKSKMANHEAELNEVTLALGFPVSDIVIQHAHKSMYDKATQHSYLQHFG